MKRTISKLDSVEHRENSSTEKINVKRCYQTWNNSQSDLENSTQPNRSSCENNVEGEIIGENLSVEEYDQDSIPNHESQNTEESDQKDTAKKKQHTLYAVIDGKEFSTSKVYIQINESKKWTDKEDELLRQAIAKYGENRWEDVAKDVKTRTHAQCKQRWEKTLDSKIVKGRWSAKEDELLRNAVSEYQKGNSSDISWIEVCKKVPGRTNKQCRERWNLLESLLQTNPWTEEEDRCILGLYQKWGSAWSSIADNIKDRKPEEVKKRLKQLLKDQGKKQEDNKNLNNSAPKKDSSTEQSLTTFNDSQTNRKTSSSVHSHDRMNLPILSDICSSSDSNENQQFNYKLNSPFIQNKGPRRDGSDSIDSKDSNFTNVVEVPFVNQSHDIEYDATSMTRPSVLQSNPYYAKSSRHLHYFSNDTNTPFSSAELMSPNQTDVMNSQSLSNSSSSGYLYEPIPLRRRYPSSSSTLDSTNPQVTLESSVSLSSKQLLFSSFSSEEMKSSGNLNASQIYDKGIMTSTMDMTSNTSTERGTNLQFNRIDELIHTIPNNDNHNTYFDSSYLSDMKT